jgi:uncharacterized protein YbcI
MGDPAQTPAARITAQVVKLLSDYTGRGPTKGWTSIDGDLVSIVLRDTLTRAERNLVADGKGDLVIRMRKEFQQTMKNDLIGVVEETLGRKVSAFLSDHHIEPDIAVETFVLEPAR